jgi:hypothetical protein
MNAMLGLAELLVLLPLLGFGLLVGMALLAMGFWIWMLIDCATKESSAGNDKLIWVLIILFTHLLGAFLYCVIRRPRRKAELGA